MYSRAPTVSAVNDDAYLTKNKELQKERANERRKERERLRKTETERECSIGRETTNNRQRMIAIK